MLKFMMQSRLNAALFVGLFSVGVFIMPLVFVLSIAGVSLVTLQKGAIEGAMVALLAGAVLTGLTLLAGGGINGIVILLGLTWLPAIIISSQVKNLGNITYGLSLGFGLALLILGLLYLITSPEPAKYWLEFFETNLEPVLAQLKLPVDMFNELKTSLVANMNNLLTSSIVLLVAIGVLLGRYWQARLYNPGGFAREFMQLSYGKLLAVITLAVLGISLLDQGFKFFADLERSFIMLFLLQGLAIVHFFADKKGFGGGILFVLYIGLFLLPFLALFLAMLGILDNWFGFRSKLSS